MNKGKLNELEINMILNTPPRKVTETEIQNDLTLSENDRIKQAADILNNRNR